MARFLIGTIPFAGHVNPGLPIAQKLVERGHDVRWYTGAKFQKRVEAVGAQFVPMKRALDFDDQDLLASFPDRKNYSGLAQLKFDLIHIFSKSGIGQVQDYQELLKDYPADVLLSDVGFAGPSLLHELGGPPWAVFGITALTLRSRDTAPFGLAMYPNSSAAGRRRNQLLEEMVNRVIFREVNTTYQDIRVQFGLPRNQKRFFDVPMSPFLYLQSTIPEFEYPRSDLPSQMHFIGAFLPETSGPFTPPDWWHEVTQKKSPVILVTQGTLATDFEELMVPALLGLANEKVLVIVTTAGKTLHSPKLPSMPSNVRIASYLPYNMLMPFVDVLVTNGGYGTIQIALSHGVPIVASGNSEDKPEICNRVAWAGVGVRVKAKQPTPEQIRNAVNHVIAQPQYKARAEVLKDEFAKYNAAEKAVELLEQLVARQQV